MKKTETAWIKISQPTSGTSVADSQVRHHVWNWNRVDHLQPFQRFRQVVMLCLEGIHTLPRELRSSFDCCICASDLFDHPCDDKIHLVNRLFSCDSASLQQPVLRLGCRQLRTQLSNDLRCRLTLSARRRSCLAITFATT